MSNNSLLSVESPRPSPEPGRSPSTGRRYSEADWARTPKCLFLIGTSGWAAGLAILAVPELDLLMASGAGPAILFGILTGATIGGIAGCLVRRPQRPLSRAAGRPSGLCPR